MQHTNAPDHSESIECAYQHCSCPASRVKSNIPKPRMHSACPVGLKSKPKAAGEYNCRARGHQRGARRRGYSLEAHGDPWDCRASALAALLSNTESKCGPLWIVDAAAFGAN
eukprot:7605088-Pyramimonas_sp.AAC.1